MYDIYLYKVAQLVKTLKVGPKVLAWSRAFIGGLVKGVGRYCCNCQKKLIDDVIGLDFR